MGPRDLRTAAIGFVAAVFSGVSAVGTAAAAAPPPPKTFGGASVSMYADGLMNPTSFAWGDGTMFAGDAGNSQKLPNGGVYIVGAQSATKMKHGPLFVSGMTWHNGGLYLADAYMVKGAPTFRIERWSGFRSGNFRSRRVLYNAPRGFQGFDGLAFGPHGRLYVGVDAGLLNRNDHGPASLSPYLYDILSMSPTGKDVKVFASGIRQPWQMASSPGGDSLLVSDLGQDGPKAVLKQDPPDFVLRVKQGQDYGFPTCNWIKGSPCSGMAKPLKSFAPHSSIMGMAIIGRTLYMGSFTGMGGRGGGAVYAMPLSGGKVTPVIAGIPAATDALAAHDGELYVGGETQKGDGVVYQVKLH